MNDTCTIISLATGEYHDLIKGFHESCEEKFLPERNKKYIFLTDKRNNPDIDASFLEVKSLSWPNVVLYTYHMILIAQREILKSKFVFYLDIDMKVVNEVRDEILPCEQFPYVGVAHPGYFMNQTPNLPYGTPEDDPKSQAYFDPIKVKPKCYYAGALQGGLSKKFVSACHEMTMAVDIDRNNSIRAKWNDESHWNKFLSNKKNEIKTLTPLYCFPEKAISNYGLDPKIITLSKNSDWTDARRMPELQTLWG